MQFLSRTNSSRQPASALSQVRFFAVVTSPQKHATPQTATLCEEARAENAAKTATKPVAVTLTDKNETQRRALGGLKPCGVGTFSPTPWSPHPQFHPRLRPI